MEQPLKVRKTIDKLTVGPTNTKIQEMLSAKGSNKFSKNPSDIASGKSNVNLKKKRKLNLMTASLLFLLLIPATAKAQNNPCQQSNNIQNRAVTFSSATTTKLIDNGTNPQRQVFVCNFTITLVGGATANTLLFNQGTGATCGTGNTAIGSALTGPGAATDTMIITSTPVPFGRLIAGNSLCGTTSQATNIGGFITFVFVGQATP